MPTKLNRGSVSLCKVWHRLYWLRKLPCFYDIICTRQSITFLIKTYPALLEYKRTQKSRITHHLMEHHQLNWVNKVSNKACVLPSFLPITYWCDEMNLFGKISTGSNFALISFSFLYIFYVPDVASRCLLIRQSIITEC